MGLIGIKSFLTPVLELSIHGRAGHAEHPGKFCLAALASIVDLEEQFALRTRKFRLLAFSPLGACHGHAFPRAHAAEVPLELGDHRRHVEQQSSNGVRGVISSSTQAEGDAFRRQFVRDLTGVAQRSGEPVELGDERVARAHCRERLSEPGLSTVGSRRPVIDIDDRVVNTQRQQVAALSGEVLICSRDPGISRICIASIHSDCAADTAISMRARRDDGAASAQSQF